MPRDNKKINKKIKKLRSFNEKRTVIYDFTIKEVLQQLMEN